MSSRKEEDQIPVQDEAEVGDVDATGEDELTKASEGRQLNAEASELDQSNIIDNQPGVTTRGKKIDAMKQVRDGGSHQFADSSLTLPFSRPQEREIDAVIDDAEAEE